MTYDTDRLTHFNTGRDTNGDHTVYICGTLYLTYWSSNGTRRGGGRWGNGRASKGHLEIFLKGRHV